MRNFFFLFLILGMSIGNSPYVSTADIVEFDGLQLVVDLIHHLEDEAVYRDGILIGWPYRVGSSGESDERMYVGYNTGLAGIGSFLLDAYEAGVEEAETLLNQTIDHLLTRYQVSRISGIYWGRFTEIETAGWTGLRYGSAGIIKFFAELINSSFPVDLDWYIPKAHEFLMNQQLDDGSWPMSENGYITNDIEYGAVGVGMTLLDLFKTTANSTYLDDAVAVADTLIGMGSWDDNKFNIPWTPARDVEEYNGLILTSYGAGEAGIMKFLLEIYGEIGEDTYETHALGLATDLVDRNQGGYWLDNSVGYITKITGPNDALLGYDVGSSGIGSQFIDLYLETLDTSYLEITAQVQKILFQLKENDTIPLGVFYRDNAFNGFSKGGAGAAWFLLDVFEKLGHHPAFEDAGRILESISEDFYSHGNVQIDRYEPLLGYSFNIEDGVAGVGKVILRFLEAEVGFSLSTYSELYEQAVPTTVSEDITDPFNPRILIFSSSVLLLLVLLIRKLKS